MNTYLSILSEWRMQAIRDQNRIASRELDYHGAPYCECIDCRAREIGIRERLNRVEQPEDSWFV